MTSIVSKRLSLAEMPHRVFDLTRPPTELHLVGELPRIPAVAVVGTRHPTEEALTYTNELVVSLGARGLAIWSGGAHGIDATAHRTALQIGAPTVVVAPAGWGHPFPPDHAELYQQIVEKGGAYLSLVPAGRAAQLHQFFARNELLAALVQVVVVVQAGLRSGARNAAKFARRLGRPLLVVPSSPWIHQGLGCNAEIALGASPLLSPRDVVKAIDRYGLCSAAIPIQPEHVESFSPSESGATSVHTVASSKSRARRPASRSARAQQISRQAADPEAMLDDELCVLLELLRGGARDVETLCQRTGLAVPVVQSDVLRLTMLGQVRSLPNGTIEVVTTR